MNRYNGFHKKHPNSHGPWNPSSQVNISRYSWWFWFCIIFLILLDDLNDFGFATLFLGWCQWPACWGWLGQEGVSGDQSGDYHISDQISDWQSNFDHHNDLPDQICDPDQEPTAVRILLGVLCNRIHGRSALQGGDDHLLIMCTDSNINEYEMWNIYIYQSIDE